MQSARGATIGSSNSDNQETQVLLRRAIIENRRH